MSAANYSLFPQLDPAAQDVGLIAALNASGSFLRRTFAAWLPIGIAAATFDLVVTIADQKIPASGGWFGVLGGIGTLAATVWLVRRLRGFPGNLLARSGAAFGARIGASLITGALLLPFILVTLALNNSLSTSALNMFKEYLTSGAFKFSMSAPGINANESAILFALGIITIGLALYAALRLSQATTAAALGDGITAAIRTSWRVTEGNLTRIVGWGIGVFLISILVLMLLSVVTAPISVALGTALAENPDKISITTGPVSEFFATILWLPVVTGIWLTLFERISARR